MTKRHMITAALSLLAAAAIGFVPATVYAGQEHITGNLDVQIRKSAEWTDETDGDAEISLQYSSNSGTITGTEDMDVVLIQDKSGSMDSDYGYHLYMTYYGRSETGAVKTYIPARTTDGEPESAAENMENSGYFKEVTYDSDGNRMVIGEYGYNAPCQIKDHYYFLIKDDSKSGKSGGYFVPGVQLYNILCTDFHHYVRLDSYEEALQYIAQGRRVVKSAKYYDENGNAVNSDTENVYFLDVSRQCLIQGEDHLILQTADDACNAGDRLAKSQEFMNRISEMIYEKNDQNAISYIPFWADVPTDDSQTGTGTWTNLSSVSNSADSELFTDTRGNRLISSMSGTYALDFCSALEKDKLSAQINNSFTYNGTNWTNAFRKALEQIEARRAAGINRQTLIVFLTDGYPQGYAGRSEDVNNPLLNASTEISLLNALGNVTIYACGTGVNEADTTGLAARLDSIDSTGQAAYARDTYQFDALYQTIEARVNSQYEITVSAREMIYHDVLSDDFELDETEAASYGIKVMDTCSSELTSSVPSDVYANLESSKAVYVRSTKTVYWYIGEAQDGTFDDDGHSFSFPVKFLHYEEVTGDGNILYASNDMQKATYYSTASPDTEMCVSMKAPTLVFHRDADPVITVKLQLKYEASEALTKNYVITSKPYSSSADENIICGRGTISIPSGSSCGEFNSGSLTPGTYYIYETDDTGDIDVLSMQKVTLTENAEIKTEAKSTDFPDSRVSSDGTQLDNYNNFLQIRMDGASVLYTDDTVPVGDLTVVKTIDSDSETIWWEHGNPTFLIEVNGTGADGETFTFSHLYEFTKKDVDEYAENGKISISYTFQNVPVCENCTVREVKMSRYQLKEISGDGENVTTALEPAAGMENLYALVNLKTRSRGTTVTFYNVKNNYEWDNHITSVSNIISWE